MVQSLPFELTEESMERTMQNMSDAMPTEAVATNPLDQTLDAGLQMGESPAEEDGGDAEDLRMLQQLLSEHYELRNNVVAGRLEFRLRDGSNAPFRQLTIEAENSMIIQAKLALGDVKGLKSNLTMLLHSEEIEEYDPVSAYLSNLPHWDGQNRVAELFGRLPGISSENILRCSVADACCHRSCKAISSTG